MPKWPKKYKFRSSDWAEWTNIFNASSSQKYYKPFYKWTQLLNGTRKGTNGESPHSLQPSHQSPPMKSRKHINHHNWLYKHAKWSMTSSCLLKDHIQLSRRKLTLLIWQAWLSKFGTMTMIEYIICLNLNLLKFWQLKCLMKLRWIYCKIMRLKVR